MKNLDAVLIVVAFCLAFVAIVIGMTVENMSKTRTEAELVKAGYTWKIDPATSQKIWYKELGRPLNK